MTATHAEPVVITRSATQTIAAHMRAVVAVLDALPGDVEAPTHTDTYEFLSKPTISWLLIGGNDQKARAAAIMRGLGGKWAKHPADYFRFTSERDGVNMHISVDRAEVCERLVTGTHEETVEVPDPTVNVPTVTETRLVEDFEWVCAPVLGGTS